jgi:uncharacterized membrane protein YraQ (UPF0718 family)
VKRLLKNNAFQYLSISALIILTVYGLNAAKGIIVTQTVYLTFFEILDIMVAVSIFIGLFQVWVKPATIVRWLGKGSGVRGFAFVCTFPIFMGGSLFTIFPLLKALKEKGARTGAIASFITAWGGKAPLLPLETKFLGWPFALLRLSLVVGFAFLMGILMDWVGERPTESNVSEIRIEA